MNFSKYIACICEGAAEQVVIERLLDEDKLTFSYPDLIDEEVIRCRDAKKFEKQYLGKGFSDKITVLRILDSRRENFNLSAAYKNKIDVINIITAPEIEMLVILNEHKYNEFKKSRKKPSDFCKQDLHYKYVKNTEFLKDYFSDADDLIAAIKEYKRISDIPKGEFTLADLLK